MHSGGHEKIKETSRNPDAHRPPLGSLAVRLSAGRHELWVRVALVNAFYMKSSHRVKKNRNASCGRERNPVSLVVSPPWRCLYQRLGNQGAAESFGISFLTKNGLYESVGIFVVSLVVVMNELVNENTGQLANLVFQAQE